MVSPNHARSEASRQLGAAPSAAHCPRTKRFGIVETRSATPKGRGPQGFPKGSRYPISGVAGARLRARRHLRLRSPTARSLSCARVMGFEHSLGQGLSLRRSALLRDRVSDQEYDCIQWKLIPHGLVDPVSSINQKKPANVFDQQDG